MSEYPIKADTPQEDAHEFTRISENHQPHHRRRLRNLFCRKYQTQDIPELTNITAPEKVKKIHEEYLNAGAKFIRTNTFASNTETLQEDFAEVEKNIQAAVEIARDAVNGRDAWIAGDIGPIPVNGAEDAAAAADEYYQIAKTFAECGVTVLDFETFADLDGILPAIKKICAEYEMFIMVSFSVNQFGYSAAGLSAKRLLADAAAVPEIDAVGLNCGVGPAICARSWKRQDVLGISSCLRSRMRDIRH